jgi:hypothetical protein
LESLGDGEHLQNLFRRRQTRRIHLQVF